MSGIQIYVIYFSRKLEMCPKDMDAPAWNP